MKSRPRTFQEVFNDLKDQMTSEGTFIEEVKKEYKFFSYVKGVSQIHDTQEDALKRSKLADKEMINEKEVEESKEFYRSFRKQVAEIARKELEETIEREFPQTSEAERQFVLSWVSEMDKPSSEEWDNIVELLYKLDDFKKILNNQNTRM